MTREEVMEKVIEFAAMAFKKDAGEIKEETNISQELGVSSLQRITMSASIENEFDVTIPVARFGNFTTIGDLVDYIMDEM
ncbi:MAG TPA: acyl carrier protein [Candidatus Blautia faecavium]|uniref:Acyl carrier protein n=1 Tax=Candidatus Blautia faecavium TaxID=2838487 RepID=A0A9D2LQK2_9FIRM|nr:acyl carrier protein [Candidatus Blautia faecavium]